MKVFGDTILGGVLDRAWSILILLVTIYLHEHGLTIMECFSCPFIFFHRIIHCAFVLAIFEPRDQFCLALPHPYPAASRVLTLSVLFAFYSQSTSLQFAHCSIDYTPQYALFDSTVYHDVRTCIDV